MTPLKEGDKAPYFEGINQDGKKITLDDFKGKKLILYFYPKDIRLNAKLYLAINFKCEFAEFIAKYNLAFNLIADTEKKILEAYGVWAEKKLYGRTYMGVVRTTFIINANGIIERIITKVNTKDHAKQILE